MYSIRQDYIDEDKVKHFDLERDDFDEFKRAYRSLAPVAIDLGPAYQDKGELSARIIIDICCSSKEDYIKKIRLARAIAPVMEVVMDRAIKDQDKRYLFNYREKGFLYEEGKNHFRISLGDSNPRDFSLAIISLYYAFIYDKVLVDKYLEKFVMINDRIIAGGFNSASFNGLQGYYFSSYFIKWILDLIEDALEAGLIEMSEIKPLYELINYLDNPKDRILASRKY